MAGNEMSLLALLEEEVLNEQGSEPTQVQTPGGTECEGNDDDGDDDEGNDDDDDDDLEAELEAELDDIEDDDEEEDGEDEEGDGTETEPPTAPTGTPGPSSVAPTPAASTPADQETESDDKIGEDDIDDVDDVDITSIAATPAASTQPMPSPGPVSFAAASTADGGLESVIQEDAEDEEMEDGAGESASVPEMQKRKQAQQDGGCQLTTEEIERIFDMRQKNESKIAAHFDLIQMERYERFKRSKIKNPSMKKLVDALAGKAVNPNVVMALCGVTKMFVGELVENARKVAARGGHHGPLLPTHVYEAHQIMQASGSNLPPQKRARLFR